MAKVAPSCVGDFFDCLFFLQGGYSPTGNVSEMYGSIGNYSAYAPNNTLAGYGGGGGGWREHQQQMT